MNRVIPGILEKNWEEIERKLEKLKLFTNTVHIDLIDGNFASNTTFLDPKPFEKYSKDIFFEAHLMVENPLQYLKPFATAGFKRFLGHIEKMEDLSEFVAEGQILGEVGLALDCDTNIEDLNINFDDLDTVLLMSVKAGQSGQSFLPQTLEKIKKIREKTTIPIEIDGGLNEQTIVQARMAGANRFVSTSFISDSPDPLLNFQKLEGLIKA